MFSTVVTSSILSERTFNWLTRPLEARCSCDRVETGKNKRTAAIVGKIACRMLTLIVYLQSASIRLSA